MAKVQKTTLIGPVRVIPNVDVQTCIRGEILHDMTAGLNRKLEDPEFDILKQREHDACQPRIGYLVDSTLNTRHVTPGTVIGGTRVDDLIEATAIEVTIKKPKDDQRDFYVGNWSEWKQLSE